MLAGDNGVWWACGGLAQLQSGWGPPEWWGGEKDYAVYPPPRKPNWKHEGWSCSACSPSCFLFHVTVNCFLLLKSLMQYQPLWLQHSPFEAISTLRRSSVKPGTITLTPKVHYAPGKTCPQQHHRGSRTCSVTRGRAVLLGQIENDLGKCGSHPAPFAHSKLWLERRRIKNKNKS